MDTGAGLGRAAGRSDPGGKIGSSVHRIFAKSYSKYVSLMDGVINESLQVLFGFSVWVSAVAVPTPLGHIQLSEIVGATGWFVLARHPGLKNRTLQLILALVVAGWVLGLVARPDLQAFEVFGYYMVIVLPWVAVGALWLSDAASAMMVFRGFLAGGIVSSVWAIGQAIGLGEMIDVRNNSHFSIVHQGTRANGLMPEASALAGLMIVAIGLMVAIDLSTDQRSRQESLTNRALIALFGVVLILTQSSSIIVVLPIVLLVAVLTAGQVTSRRVAVSVAVVAITAALITTILLFRHVLPSNLTVERLDSASAIRSANARWFTIKGVYRYFAEGRVLGVGLGGNNLISQYVPRSRLNVSSGVNSLTASRFFESGLLVLAPMVLGLRSIWRLLRLGRGHRYLVGQLMASVCLATTVSLGYRGYLFGWLWATTAFVLATNEPDDHPPRV